MANNNPKITSNDKSITVVKRKTNKVGNYILGQTIGEGGFAKVKLATHIYTQQHVAIKLLAKDKIIKEQSDLIRIKKEINILKQLKHKNIIQLYEIMESTSVLYIVMEYCEGKELFDYIIKRNRITEREACRFFQQIINGVEYLHLQNITHRDLKPENLLLDNKKRIKISDFGLSTYSDDNNELLKTSCGTPSYAPPEMLRGDVYNGRYSDIWSCGIILYTMLCGNLPCAESTEDLIYDNIMTHEMDYPSYLSPLAVDLMNKLLAINPLKRPDFDAIKQHPWFNLIESQLRPGLLIDIHRIPVDENILVKVEKYGYDREKCKESIINNRFDSFSCIYYLILKEFSKEGKQSVSDLSSENYVNFLRNINNWVKPQEAKNKKYDDYWPEDDNGQFELVLPNKIVTKGGTKGKEKDQPMKELVIANQCISEQFVTEQQRKEQQIKEESIMKSSKNVSFQLKTSSKLHQAIVQTEEEEDNVIDHKVLKQKLLKITKENESFLKSLRDIDAICHTNINTITPLANKLIKGTIFSKYISNSSSASQGLIQDASELKCQFNLMQKYKAVIERIEMTHPGIFPKKINDSNYTSFDTFLIEEEDFVFANDFLKTKCNIDFIEKIKRGIQSYHRKVNSQQYHSERERKPNHCAFSSPKNPDRTKDKRKRRQIVSISSYITDKHSEDSAGSLDPPSSKPQRNDNSNRRSNSNSNTKSLHHWQFSTKTTIQEDNISNESKRKLVSNKKSSFKTESRNINYIKPQLTTRTKDAKKQKTRKDFYIDEFMMKTDYKKKIQFETPKYKPTDIINRLQVKCVGSRNNEIHLGPFTKNVNSFNQLNLKNAFIHQFNRNRKTPSTTKNHHKKSLSFHQRSENSLGKNMSTSLTEQNKSETDHHYQQHQNNSLTKRQEIISQLIVYSGIVDIECCIESNSLSEVVSSIRIFFKNNNFFCFYTNNKLICSRDKTMIEIALMKLLQTSMVYLKIKKIKGDRELFQRISKQLLTLLK